MRENAIVRRHGALCWRRYGDPRAPTVVLLHPIATDGSVWRKQAESWQDRFDVLAIDLPGHGRSALLSGDQTIQAFSDIIAGTLQDAGVARAAFVGLSIGSMIAQRLAADHSHLAAATVLANGVAWTTEDAATGWSQRVAVAETDGMAALRDPMLERWFTPSYLADKHAEVARIASLIVGTSATGFAAAARAIRVLDNREALTRITCPTLVIASELDSAAPLPAVEAIARSISGASFAKLPSGHLANVESPEQFTSLAGDFLHAEMAAASW